MPESTANKAAAAESAYFFVNSAVPMLTKSTAADAAKKIAEETEELKTADDAHRVEEGGDLLFAVVNALRFYKVEPELALSEANKKFVRRFTAVENAVKASGKDMKDCSLDELDAIWNRVKQQEKQNDKQ